MKLMKVGRIVLPTSFFRPIFAKNALKMEFWSWKLFVQLYTNLVPRFLLHVFESTHTNKLIDYSHNPSSVNGSLHSIKTNNGNKQHRDKKK